MRSPTDRHPTDGTLRRLLDEPAGVADVDRDHVAGCPVCLRGLAAAREDAVTAATALSCETTPDVDLAWRRFSAATVPSATGSAAARTPAPTRRRLFTLRSPVVAVLGLVVVLGGASAAAAGDWFQIFRTEQVVPVQVSVNDLVALPDLSNYGDLQVTSEPHVHAVADAAAAEQAAGLRLPGVDRLPRGVTGEPSYTVGGQVTAEFTFSAEKATRAAAAAGHSLPTLPPGLDGSRFRLVAGPGAAEIWSEGRGIPALAVVRLAAPTAYSSGAPFATARDYLLSLPGLPAHLADQLRGFTGAGTTLPLPVPAELATSSTADVNGHQATVLASRDRTVHGVVWVENGVVTGVAGLLGEDEVLAVARNVG
jgi:hypothetical protein